MSSILIGIFTLVLVIICILLVLVILMQRPNANSGMGAALGGGAAEGMFGGEAGQVLTRATVKLTVLFFVISAGLYLGYIWKTGGSQKEEPKEISLTSLTVEAKPETKKEANPATEVAKKAEVAPVASDKKDKVEKPVEKKPNEVKPQPEKK